MVIFFLLFISSHHQTDIYPQKGDIETALAHVRSWALTLAKEMAEEQYSFDELKAMNATLIAKIQDTIRDEENEEIAKILEELAQRQADIDKAIKDQDDDATQLQYRTLSHALTIRSNSQAQESARQASLSFSDY